MPSDERRVGLAIMAKAPRVGHRVQQEAPRQLRRLRCPQRRAPERVRAVAGVEPILAYTPTEARSELEALAPGFALIPQRGVVLGPTEDGGYYLLGLRAPRRGLFEDVPWSTAAVLSRTLDRAQRLGLRVACLPTWFDVDTGADLDRLRTGLDADPGRFPRHTREFLIGRIRAGGDLVKLHDHENHNPDSGGAEASRGR